MKLFSKYALYVLMLLSGSLQATLSIINKSTETLRVQAKIQVGDIDRGNFESFEQAIAPDGSEIIQDFSILLDLKTQLPDKSWQEHELPPFEDQKGHLGDDLTITLHEKKEQNLFSWIGFGTSKKITVSYKWSKKFDGERVVAGLKRPGWYDITDAKRQTLQEHLATHVRRVFYFDKDISSSKTMLEKPRHVLFSIHGTFARESKEFYDPDNTVFEKILAYAETLGHPIEVVALEWTGENSKLARIAAGQYTAQLINEHYGDRKKYLTLNAISHSHGGNVVYTATHSIKRPFNVIISLFTPTRTDIDWFVPKPGSFSKIYHFYSTSDHVQFLGSINIKTANWLNIITKQHHSRKMIIQKQDLHATGRIYNIRIEYAGISPAHVNKQAVVAYLPQIIRSIDATYKINYDLDVDIDPDRNEILISVRHPVDPKIVALAGKDIQDQVEKELEQSNKAKAQYILKYKKEMGKKGWRLVGVLREFEQTFYDIMQ